MVTEVKDNNLKGNVFNVGLINNVAQANTEINTDISINNKLEIKAGFTNTIKTYISKKTYKYIGEHKYDKAKYEYELAQRIAAIPDENIVKPRLSIAGPALESLKYNLDENQIREMFTNLLIGEIDNRKQSKISPGFIEVIKQLSYEDAKFIISLKETKKKMLSIVHIIALNSDGISFFPIKKYISVNTNKKDCLHTISPNNIVLDNLIRLGIIKIKEEQALPDNKEYNIKVFNYVKNNHILDNNLKDEYKIDFKEEILEITDFGQQFIEICCS